MNSDRHHSLQNDTKKRKKRDLVFKHFYEHIILSPYYYKIVYYTIWNLNV